MKLTPQRKKGNIGEEYAAKYLKKQGYKILGRNYLKPYGEIDIIASYREYIVFVEVKTRHENSVIAGTQAVNRIKQQRIIKAASSFYSENKLDCNCRFDVCEVIIDAEKLKPIKCIHIKNAFMQEGDYAPL